jgi:hypothetical protein
MSYRRGMAVLSGASCDQLAGQPEPPGSCGAGRLAHSLLYAVSVGFSVKRITAIERLAGWGCTHWIAPPSPRRTPISDS